MKNRHYIIYQKLVNIKYTSNYNFPGKKCINYRTTVRLQVNAVHINLTLIRHL